MPLSDLSPQDDLLLVEALVRLSYDLRDAEPERSARAWDMANAIAESHGLAIGDAVMQIGVN